MAESSFIAIIYLISGISCGFFSSAPLGPINLWLTQSQLQQPRIKPFAFITGVICADLCFAALAIYGYHHFVASSPYLPSTQIIIGIFLIILGISCFYKIRYNTSALNPQNTSNAQSGVQTFILGLFLCGSNPGFLLFWVFIVDLLNQWPVTGDMGFINLLFLLGVCAGDFIWFHLLVKWVNKGLNLAKPVILQMIRYSIALGYTVFGILAVAKGYNSL